MATSSIKEKNHNTVVLLTSNTIDRNVILPTASMLVVTIVDTSPVPLRFFLYMIFLSTSDQTITPVLLTKKEMR